MSTRRGIFGVLAGAVAAPVAVKLAPAAAEERFTHIASSVTELVDSYDFAEFQRFQIKAIEQAFGEYASLARDLGLATKGIEEAAERQVDLIRSGGGA